jgi:hypothetical protein
LAHDDAAEAFVARLLGDREDLLAEARRDLAPQAWAAVDRTPVQPPGNDRSAHDARPAATSPRGVLGPSSMVVPAHLDLRACGPVRPTAQTPDHARRHRRTVAGRVLDRCLDGGRHRRTVAGRVLDRCLDGGRPADAVRRSLPTD